jgi:hypothetical protein
MNTHEKIEAIKAVSKGMDLTIELKDIPLRDIIDLSKKFGGNLFEPCTSLPYYWTHYTDEGLKVKLRGSDLVAKTVTTFETK